MQSLLSKAAAFEDRTSRYATAPGLKMLRLFHRDAFGELLDAPREVGTTVLHRIPDVTAEDDPMRSLELVANDFGINPKPQLVLFLEGATEATVLPLMFDQLYGAKPSV